MTSKEVGFTSSMKLTADWNVVSEEHIFIWMYSYACMNYITVLFSSFLLMYIAICLLLLM